MWLRALAPFALAAGLADHRTRVPVAISLGVAAALTFGLSQGARAAILAAVGAIVVVVTFHGLFYGPTRDKYLRTPVAADAIVARVPAPEGIMWVAPGIPAPRWISYISTSRYGVSGSVTPIGCALGTSCRHAPAATRIRSSFPTDPYSKRATTGWWTDPLSGIDGRLAPDRRSRRRKGA